MMTHDRIEEILAEAPGVHLGFEIAVRRMGAFEPSRVS